MTRPSAAAHVTPFRNAGQFGPALTVLLHGLEYLSGFVLALDVMVVFVAVIYRYFLHDPVDWAEEIARALMVMQVFFGAATVLGRERHVGIDTFRGLLPARWGPAMVQLCYWIIVGVALSLFLSSCELFADSRHQTTSFGLPQIIFVVPVVIGSFIMALFGIANALAGPTVPFGERLRPVSPCRWPPGRGMRWFRRMIRPWFLLFAGFFGGLIIGVPIAFVLAFSSLLFFLSDPSLPMLVYSQTIVAGMDHFVLLAIPFFVLAGMVMEANGMSSRLIELLLRVFGRMRGGLNLITITATAFFSGISGSKLADIAAVGGIIMPAVRRTKQDANDAAGLLAATAVMAETIPPCVNMIILGFVANISIGGLFMAGLVPAGVLALALAAVAIYFGKRINPADAFEVRTPMIKLLGGALVGLLMILMIGKGVTSGVATSTEVSAFAVVYAFLVGGLAFRELTWKSSLRLFVQSGSLTGTILFIVAAASSVSYALTILQIPQYLSAAMIWLGHNYGSNSFVVVSVLLMILFGAVLEGAPALIIFGPLLAPIATRLGVHPLHFGTVMVIAMGLGLFSPPIGLGLFATCAITDTKLENVWRPMLKYLLVLFVVLIVLVFVPTFSLWLPARLGLA